MNEQLTELKKRERKKTDTIDQIIEYMSDFMTGEKLKFFSMQLCAAYAMSKGKQIWPEKDKVIAMPFFYQSAKAYKF